MHDPHDRRARSWHPEFQDLNNDGRVDLYVSKGNVDAMHDRAAEDPSSLMLGSAKDRFVELTTPAGLVSFRASARPSDAR